MKSLLSELNLFLGKAALSTYAGSGQETVSKEIGFNELEYKEGKWSYKDSYTGFFQSWGRETVWLNEKPFWTQIYGGGMTKKYQTNSGFAHKTFTFLKQALSSGEKKNTFQPRGPKKFVDNDWKYSCEWKGAISEFEGHEKILFKNKLVFNHHFRGGLIISN